MTDVMVQPVRGPTAPTSRQDIISVLLNDYGNSFGRGDASSSLYSPVLAMKELPPPPPSKSLAAFQRMNMKFQLRDEDTPSSHSPRRNSAAPKSRKRIVSRSLSRERKPPSLKLTISNGTTATIPPTPLLPTRVLPLLRPAQAKELPPPPPEKSARRFSRQAPMEKDLSKVVKDCGRSDSLLSQGKAQASSGTPLKPVDPSLNVKWKALPETTVRKLKSFAEFGQGSRGEKEGPLPSTSASSKISLRGQVSEALPSKVTMSSQVSEDLNSDSSDVTATPENVQQQAKARANNQLPPTPAEDQFMALPALPRKPVAAVGLSSNPRSKAPASAPHMRGQSSIGFSVLQPHRAAPPQPPASLTPEMTPSPKPKPIQLRKEGSISPLLPLLPPTDQHHPSSFKTAAETQKTTIMQPARVPSPVRPTSSDLTSPSSEIQSPPFPAVPSRSQPRVPQSPVQLANSPPPASPVQQPPPPPFVPLTRRPSPFPSSLIPAITPTHLDCYTSHATYVWSGNALQPLGCMVCRKNEPDRKWSCTWCRLRICFGCSEELKRVKGRDLAVLMKRRGTGEVRRRGQ